MPRRERRKAQTEDISARRLCVAPSEPVIYNWILLSGSNSVVECDLAKVEVAGSNPVSRSRFSSIQSPGSFFFR
jgi:hypothetical protein